MFSLAVRTATGFLTIPKSGVGIEHDGAPGALSHAWMFDTSSEVGPDDSILKKPGKLFSPLGDRWVTDFATYSKFERKRGYAYHSE